MQKNSIPYWYWESEIPPEFCNLIVKYGKKEELQAAKVGMGVNGALVESVRKSKIAFLNPDKFGWIYSMLWAYMMKANANSGWNFTITGQQSPQFTIYDESFFYDFHEDASDHEEGMRKLSLVVFLSNPKNYSGGKFEFRNSGTPETNKQGSILVFPSFLMHRVTPVTEGTRYSLVNWFTGPALV